jgi:hypothetical protein
MVAKNKQLKRKKGEPKRFLGVVVIILQKFYG